MVTSNQSCGNNIGLPIFIKCLKDERSNLGKRHELYVVIIIAIMGLMNGYLSFRGLEAFAERNKKDFYKIFKLKKKRLPKRDTFRRIFSQIEFEELNKVFEKWINPNYTKTLLLIQKPLPNRPDNNFLSIHKLF